MFDNYYTRSNFVPTWCRDCKYQRCQCTRAERRAKRGAFALAMLGVAIMQVRHDF